MDASSGIKQNGSLIDDKPVQIIVKDAGFSNEIEMNEVGESKRKYELQNGNTKLNKSQHEGFFQRNKPHLLTARNCILLVLYLAYYSYAMFCNFGDESSIQLTVFTSFGIHYLSWNKVMTYKKLQKTFKSVLSSIYMAFKYGSRPKIIRWVLYLVWLALVAYYLVVNVALKNPRKLRSLGGYALLILLLVLLSNNKRKVITWFSDRLEEFMDYSKVGAEFVFGETYIQHRIAMQIESAILVVEYIDAMPTSRLFTLITNWFASCGGSALIHFIAFGVPSVYLLAASAMSAPAALVCAKLAYPDTEQSNFKDNTEDPVLEVLTQKNRSNFEAGAYSNPNFVNESDTSFVTNSPEI